MEEDVDQIVGMLGTSVIDRFWVYAINRSEKMCEWDQFSPESNCAFLKNIMEVTRNRFKVPVEIVANIDEWT